MANVRKEGAALIKIRFSSCQADNFRILTFNIQTYKEIFNIKNR